MSARETINAVMQRLQLLQVDLIIQLSMNPDAFSMDTQSRISF
jgi:hypothetical protein